VTINKIDDTGYERYLPTAFDESLSLLQKVNKLLKFLNLVIDQSNATETTVTDGINQLNLDLAQVQTDFDTLETWVKGEGLVTDITAILNTWYSDGTLATIINDNVFSMKANKTDLDNFGLSPMNYGAIGDGIVDDTQALKTFFQLVQTKSGGCSVKFPHGKRFKITDSLGVYTFSNVTIDFNGSILDWEGTPLTSLELFTITGTYGQTTNVTADALKNGVYLNVTSTVGFSKGDLLRIYSNEIWDVSRTSTRIGEIVFIESVDSGTTLKLSTPLYDSYTIANSPKVQKITPVENIKILNGTIQGARGFDEHSGINVYAGRNIVISGITSKQVDKKHITLTDCTHSTIENCFIFDSKHASQGYGLSFADATRDCVARNNYFSGVRHSMTTNNNVSTSWGIVRKLLWDGNTINETSANLDGTSLGDAIDTHAGCEFITITNNTINGCGGNGINVEGRSAVITNNRIHNVKQTGVYLRPFVDNRPSSYVVSNNEITHSIGDDTGNADYAIRVYADVSDVDFFDVSGNIMRAAISPLTVSMNTGRLVKRIAVSGNIAEVTRTGSAFSITGVEKGSIDGNTVIALSTGININQSSFVAVNGNAVILTEQAGTNGYGIYCTASEGLSVTGNTVNNQGNFSTLSNGVRFGADMIGSSIVGNVTKGMVSPATILSGATNCMEVSNI
jgi:hypothetical protein